MTRIPGTVALYVDADPNRGYVRYFVGDRLVFEIDAVQHEALLSTAGEAQHVVESGDGRV